MNKITTSTDEQWQKIDELKNQWIENTTKQYSHEEVYEVVGRMYKSMGLEMPIVLQAPCPLSMVVWSALVSQLDSQLWSQLDSQLLSQLDSQLRSQLDSKLRSQLDSQLWSQLDSQLSSQLDSQLRSQLNSQLRSQLWSQLNSQLWSQLNSQLWSQLGSQLDSQLWSQLGSQLDSQLDSQLWSQLGSQLDSQLSSQLDSQPMYIGLFFRCWSGYYSGAKILGVNFDKEKIDLFTDWNERASVWCAYDKICVVSSNPTECHWQDQRLHNENGHAVKWPSGYGMWAIGGVAVDEQIVMRPDTQTIDQIRSEKNEEVKRIRINRFTWERYLKETKAKRIHRRKNEIEGTWESLYETPDGLKTLVCACPSTAKVFALEVEPSVATCEAAQRYLSSGLSGRIISAS